MSSSPKPSRRDMIKVSGAAAGAAFIAPQILSSAVAGAQTTICYAVKNEGGANSSVGSNGDPSCDAGFNAALLAAMGPNPQGAAGAPVTISGINSKNGTITVDDMTCTLAFVGYKAGQECYHGNGSGGISADANSASITSVKDISHVTVVVCCTSSDAND